MPVSRSAKEEEVTALGEAVANAGLLLVAGHDSTVNTITNCVMTLLRNPGSFDLLRRLRQEMDG